MRPIFAAAVAAFICTSVPARADTAGLVRGTATFAGKPAAGVAVTLRGEATSLAATTDAAGAFIFARVPFGRYTLTAQRSGTPGFSQPVDVASHAVVSVNVELQLKEIGRARTGFTRGPGATPVSVNSIDRAQIAALPDNQSLNSLIQTVPGVVRFSYNEPVAHGFHGLTYELDGVPVPQGTTSNFSEIVDPRSIDSLEVFTGAFPAEFGGSRQGAVVNILSHRVTDLTAAREGMFTLGGGSYGGAQASLFQSLRAGNTRVFFNANLERSNRGIDSPTFDPVHDDSNQSNQFVRTITNVGKNDSFAFDVSNSVSTYQIPINTSANPNDPVVVPSATSDVQREYDRFINLVYTNNAASGKAYTQIAPWYRSARVAYDGDIPNNLAGTLANAAGTTTPLDGLRQDRRAEYLGLRANHFHVYGAHSLKLGIDESVENFRGDEQIAFLDGTGNRQNFFDNSRQRGTLLGAYLQDKWTPTRSFSLLAGLRYDRSTGYVSGGQLSPRLEINAQVGRQDILHAYYGRLYAAPFLEDTRRAAVIVGGANASPTYSLAPERDSYYEVGLAHALAANSRATVNFWKRDVRNVLDTTQLAQTPIEAVFNNTIGIAKGVEARVDARFRNGDSVLLSTQLSSSRAGGISGSTFLFAPDSNPNDVTLNPEDHDQTFTALFAYTKRLGRDGSFFASLEPQYGTGYPVQFQNGPGRLPPHLTLDASIGRDAARGAHSGVGVVATFRNLTNAKYLIKVNNGFNTTQWGEGFRADLRLTAPL